MGAQRHWETGWSHPAWSGSTDPKQRLYLSATIGADGELERAFGRRRITRMAAPAGWDERGTGRRFFVFPELTDEFARAGGDPADAAALTAFVSGLIRDAGRSLLLAPSNAALEQVRLALLPPGYKAEYGVLLDMVGAKNAKFSREELSRTNARGALDKIWNTAARLGYSDYFLFKDMGGITDDHVYTNQAGVPTVDVIDTLPYGDDTFPAYHHAQSDNLANIDRKTLKAVGQTVLQALYVD